MYTVYWTPFGWVTNPAPVIVVLVLVGLAGLALMIKGARS